MRLTVRKAGTFALVTLLIVRRIAVQNRPGIRSRLVVLAGLGLIGAVGCCWSDAQCDPPLSDDVTPVSEVYLPEVWTRPENTGFRVVVTTTGPLKVSEFALDRLVDVMSQQVGLDVEIVEGTDTGLSASIVVDEMDVIDAGCAQIPTGDDPVLVIVVASDTSYPGATYGFLQQQDTLRPTAVMGLHRSAMRDILGGLISQDNLEAVTVVHEAGHWFGIPARRFHTSAVDGVHCTNGQCAMFHGARVNMCAVLANLSTGVPMTFGQDCAAELTELRRRRESN